MSRPGSSVPPHKQSKKQMDNSELTRAYERITSLTTDLEESERLRQRETRQRLAEKTLARGDAELAAKQIKRLEDKIAALEARLNQ